ncbi:MAG: hypothetical protein KDD33_03025 [Bdellovibrionales bacterium]|nr:hypothetical protein [Bdellovibrionales bacterium]
MRKLVNQGLLGAAFCLGMTSFVVGCVKNNNKGTTEEPVKEEVVLKSGGLLMIHQGSSGALNSVQYNSSEPALRLVREWDLQVLKTSELSIDYVKISPSECRDGSKSVGRRFEVESASGEKTPVLEAGNKIMLAEGKYTFRTVILNDALCNKIDYSFRAKMDRYRVIAVERNVDAGFVCQSVEKNGQVMNGHKLEVLTGPMRVLEVGRHGVSPIVGSAHLCGIRKTPDTVHCRDSVLENPARKNALVSQQQICKRGNSHNHNTPAQKIELWEEGQELMGEFNCAYRGSRSSYKLGQCQVAYNLGEALPVRNRYGRDVNIRVRQNSISIEFDFAKSKRTEDQVEERMYVNLYKIGNKDAILHKGIEISKAELESGRIVIRNGQGGAQMSQIILAQGGAQTLGLVVSYEDNMTSGIYHLPLAPYLH